MNRTPITDLSDGQSLDQVFQVGDKQLRVNRDGGKYILMKLSDRTGTIVAMNWNASEAIFESFRASRFSSTSRGGPKSTKDRLQIIATKIDRVELAEDQREDFERFDAEASQQLAQRLHSLMGELKNVHLRRLGQAYLDDAHFMGGLQTAAAAVSNHHAYPGGLLKHTVDMMELAALIGPRYPEIDPEKIDLRRFPA